MKKWIGVLLSIITIVILIGIVIIPVIAQGVKTTGIPTEISYQGYLESNGDPLTANDVSMKFSLYEAVSGGSPVWAETQLVDVNNGLLNVLLGSGSPMSADHFDGDRFLGVTVAGDSEMIPRQKLVSVAYSFQAEHANSANNAYSLSAPDGSPSIAVYVDNDGNVGIGTGTPQQTAHIGGVLRLEPQPNPPTGGMGDLYVSDYGNLYFHNGSYWERISMACNFDLELSSSIGGTVIVPGEGIYPFECGTVVAIIAQGSPNYEFERWTGSGTQSIANPGSPNTTITMDGDYSITAQFFQACGFSSSGGQSVDYSDGNWIYFAESDPAYPKDILRIEIYPSLGGPDSPGTYALQPSDTSYENCSMCITISQNCSDPGSCEKIFMPTEGTLNLTALGQNPGESFTGEILGCTLREVLIDWDTFVTTPVPGGDVWCIDSFNFDATIP